MLDILQLRSRHRPLGCILQDVVVKVAVVIDLMNEAVHAGRGLSCATFERLGADDLAIVDNELLVKRGFWD
jgi:hypothetical protein